MLILQQDLMAFDYEDRINITTDPSRDRQFWVVGYFLAEDPKHPFSRGGCRAVYSITDGKDKNRIKALSNPKTRLPLFDRVHLGPFLDRNEYFYINEAAMAKAEALAQQYHESGRGERVTGTVLEVPYRAAKPV